MDSSGIYRYEIDETDRICDVDDQWLAFAVQNGAGELTRDAVVGQSVHRYMAGWSVCELYATLFGKLRQRRSSATFPFRCDSPDLKRYMQMEISPGTNGHLMLAGRMLHSIARPRIPLLDPKTRHNGEWQIICSLCRRIPLTKFQQRSDLTGRGKGRDAAN